MLLPMTNSDFQSAVYTKGDKTKIANTPSDAVAYEFDGYTRQADAPAEVAESQTQASFDGDESQG